MHNKYLDEVGIENTDFPFVAPHSDTLDKEHGVIPCQTWNLYATLAMEIYTYLRNFQECHIGHPVCMTAKEWEKLLEKIISGFRLYLQNLDNLENTTEQKQAIYDAFDKSMDLLKENWEFLWW